MGRKAKRIRLMKRIQKKVALENKELKNIDHILKQRELENSVQIEKLKEAQEKENKIEEATNKVEEPAKPAPKRVAKRKTQAKKVSPPRRKRSNTRNKKTEK